MKKKKKLKSNNIYKFLIIVFTILFLYSLYNVIIWFIDNPKTNNIIEELNEDVIINETNENSEIIESEEPKSGLYWDFIKMNLIDVNIAELKKKNSDTVGWIQVSNTNINYPFVQTDNNDFYLNHSFTKQKNKSGWLFMDYRNDKNKINKNTIIYGHNNKSKTMFGTLNKLLNNKWFKTKENHTIKMSTESNNTLWQIFSVYTIVTTNDYIQTDFISDKKYQMFLDTIKGRSYYKFDVPLTTQDNILTLSTCYGNQKKLVVHAKLIKLN